GRFYWAVDSGHGHDDVQVVDVGTGKVRQVLPLPGAYGGIVYAPDRRTVYVSGEPLRNSQPTPPTTADAGGPGRAFSPRPRRPPARRRAAGGPPRARPAPGGGAAKKGGATPASLIVQPPGPGASSGLGWPIGLAVTPDQGMLAVALNQADQLAVVDLASH